MALAASTRPAISRPYSSGPLDDTGKLLLRLTLGALMLLHGIGKVTGGVDFSNLFYSLTGGTYPSVAAAKAAGAATINYGIFLNTLIDFAIIAFVLFMIIKGMNSMKKKEAAAAPTTKECPHCCTAIPLNAKRCPACTSPL